MLDFRSSKNIFTLLMKYKWQSESWLVMNINPKLISNQFMAVDRRCVVAPGLTPAPAIETRSGARDLGRGWERGQWRHHSASTNQRPGPLVSTNGERGDHEWWRWAESQEGESRVVLVSMKPHELRPSYEAGEAGVPGPGSALDLATASLSSDSRRTKLQQQTR